MSFIKPNAKIETDLLFWTEWDKRLTVTGLVQGPLRKEEVLPPKNLSHISALFLSLFFRRDIVRIHDAEHHYFFVGKERLINWLEDRAKEEGAEALTKAKIKALLGTLQNKKAESSLPNKEAFPLELLPNDLLYEVTSHLNLIELQALCLTSKVLNEKMMASVLWKRLADELKVKLEVPDEHLSYKQAVLKAIKEYLKKPIDEVPGVLLRDIEFVKRLVAIDPHKFSNLSDEWKDRKEIALAVVKKDGELLQHASKRLQNDREVVFVAMEQSADAIKHASSDLQKDEYCILLSEVRNGKKSLRHLSRVYKGDKRLVRNALTYDWREIRYASSELRNDKMFMLSLSSEFELSLSDAGKKLRDDKEYVLHELKRNGWELQFASKRLRDDEEVVLAAMEMHHDTIKYASKRIRKLESKWFHHF